MISPSIARICQFRTERHRRSAAPKKGKGKTNTHRPQNPKEQTRHFSAQLQRARRENSQRECETPPTHVEREWPGFDNGCEGEQEPDDAETPHDEGDEETENVCDIAGEGVEGSCGGEDSEGDFAEIHCAMR